MLKRAKIKTLLILGRFSFLYTTYLIISIGRVNPAQEQSFGKV